MKIFGNFEEKIESTVNPNGKKIVEKLRMLLNTKDFNLK